MHLNLNEICHVFKLNMPNLSQRNREEYLHIIVSSIILPALCGLNLHVFLEVNEYMHSITVLFCYLKLPM